MTDTPTRSAAGAVAFDDWWSAYAKRMLWDEPRVIVARDAFDAGRASASGQGEAGLRRALKRIAKPKPATDFVLESCAVCYAWVAGRSAGSPLLCNDPCPGAIARAALVATPPVSDNAALLGEAMGLLDEMGLLRIPEKFQVRIVDLLFRWRALRLDGGTSG